MTAPDRLAALSQRVTALTGQTLSRDQITTLIGRAFEHRVDLDDDGQLRALAAGLVSSTTAPPEISGSLPALPRPDAALSRPSPSGASAKTMAVLAVLGGISNLVLAAVWAFALGDANNSRPSHSYIAGKCLHCVCPVGLAVSVR